MCCFVSMYHMGIWYFMKYVYMIFFLFQVESILCQIKVIPFFDICHQMMIQGMYMEMNWFRLIRDTPPGGLLTIRPDPNPDPDCCCYLYWKHTTNPPSAVGKLGLSVAEQALSQSQKPLHLQHLIPLGKTVLSHRHKIGLVFMGSWLKSCENML